MRLWGRMTEKIKDIGTYTASGSSHRMWRILGTHEYEPACVHSVTQENFLGSYCVPGLGARGLVENEGEGGLGEQVPPQKTQR